MKQQIQYKEEQITSPINGSSKCFRIFSEPETSEQYLCMTTGFSSTSEHKIGSETLNQELARVPELVQTLQYYDEERDIVWIPTILNIPGKGMVFPEGTVGNWKWAFAAIIPIPEEEQKNYPIPDQVGMFYKQKYDTDNIKTYDEFLYALAELNEKLKEETEDEI